MTEFYVEPAQLETLAVKQDTAAATAQQASLATTHLKRDTEQTWGPFWQMVNDAFAKTEDKRNSAIKRLQLRRSGHADMLRAAAQIYATNDDNSAEQLTNQMPDH